MSPVETPAIRGHAVIKATQGWACACGMFLAEQRDDPTSVRHALNFARAILGRSS